GPVCLVRGELVLEAAVVGGEARCNADRVLERVAEDRRRNRRREVTIGVASGAVDHHEYARYAVVFGFHRVGTVDERAGRSFERDPFGAGRGCVDAGRGPAGRRSRGEAGNCQKSRQTAAQHASEDKRLIYTRVSFFFHTSGSLFSWKARS